MFPVVASFYRRQEWSDIVCGLVSPEIVYGLVLWGCEADFHDDSAALAKDNPTKE